jgi:hypothetical protein
MSSLQEIELAIKGLSPGDRTKLLRDLPRLIPEREGDMAWQRILEDSTPSNSLSRLVDSVDAEMASDPEGFREIKDSDFHPTT